MQALQLCEWCLKTYGLKEEDLGRLRAELQPEAVLSSATVAAGGLGNGRPEVPPVDPSLQPCCSTRLSESGPSPTPSSDLATDATAEQLPVSPDSAANKAVDSLHHPPPLPCDSGAGLESGPHQSSASSPSLKRAKLEPDGDPPLPVCAACLGLLDDAFIRRLGSFTAERLREVGYSGLVSFCLSLHTPLSLLPRKTAVGLRLRSSLGSSLLLPEESYVKDLLRSRLAGLLQKLLAPLEHDSGSPFQIVLKFDHEGCRRECDALVQLWPESFSRVTGKHWKRGRKADVNNVSVKRALEKATAQDCERLLPRTEDLCSFSVEYSHKPLYVAGRYNKFSRVLPQTPWLIDGVRKGESSVQELICARVAEFVSADETKFSSSGREDVDVRMLGSGRPFLLELVNPRKPSLATEELALLQDSINSSTRDIAVRGLAVVGRETASLLKEGEEDKQKRYSALIWTSQELVPSDVDFLADIKDLKLQQKTPIRVLHRRTLATRERTVYSLRGEFADSHHFRLFLSTQAGTYIKEFVHGDFGRTQPNLRGLMGQEVDILTLDVEEIVLDWPPHSS